jgi:hypothetical protein
MLRNDKVHKTAIKGFCNTTAIMLQHKNGSAPKKKKKGNLRS